MHRQRKPLTKPSHCEICGASALYKYFGATCCYSCKIFFRRNAERGLEVFKCRITGQCEIDVLSRRCCTSCRLTKCFAKGMLTELIRCSRQRKQFTRIQHVTSTSNLLMPDLSDLTVEQWNIIWKLNNSYQDHQTFQQLLQEQMSLPIKLRFQLTSISSFFESILSEFDVFVKSNDHLRALHHHDRSLLLRYTIENSSHFIAILLLQQTQLFDHPYVKELLENIHVSCALNDLCEQIDRDTILIKLIIVLLTFSSTSSINMPFTHWQNFEEILRTQNLYAELIWKYLLQKSDHSRAVICFDHLIKTILRVHELSQPYTSMISKIHQRLIVSG